MYLKWQGQFWSAGCSGASSASHGAAERTLCCWLLAAGHGAVPLLSAHSEEREMPLQTMSAPWVSWWKWNEHAYSWKKTTRGLPQFLHPRQVPFWCPLSKELHHHFLSMLPSAWQLAQSLCHSSVFCWTFCRPVWAVPLHWRLMNSYLLPWDHFCGDLLLRHDCALLSSYHSSCCKQ